MGHEKLTAHVRYVLHSQQQPPGVQTTSLHEPWVGMGREQRPPTAALAPAPEHGAATGCLPGISRRQPHTPTDGCHGSCCISACCQPRTSPQAMPCAGGGAAHQQVLPIADTRATPHLKCADSKSCCRVVGHHRNLPTTAKTGHRLNPHMVTHTHTCVKGCRTHTLNNMIHTAGESAPNSATA
jgi:hypothetical protein